MKLPIEKYTENLVQYNQLYAKIKSKFNTISAARLALAISIIVFAYFYFQNYSVQNGAIAILSLIGFIILIKQHSKLSFQRKLYKSLIEINQNEIDFLKGIKIPFENGEQYSDTNHAYSSDLDFFGTKSVFHVLNRTATVIGSRKLANSLLSLLSNEEIIRNQEAIKELAGQVEWRQEIYALSKVTAENEFTFDELRKWTLSDKELQSKLLHFASFLLPLAFLGLFVYNIFFDAGLGNLVVALFIANISVLGYHLKSIKRELLSSTKIDSLLSNFSLIIQNIENKEFQSQKLNDLKAKLHSNNIKASHEISTLSKLFGQLENVLNPVGAIFLNGFLLTHIHTLRGFRKWKNEHGDELIQWLEIIGEFESLNSLANFSYNNSDFTFPALNSNYEILFKGLGHPLLNSNQRVTSDVDFVKQKFIILTGSNMSGKSTFLRSLGINMVLAGVGAPVCAEIATIHPLPVLVSMRVSDSLKDSESFFFAEVKRLKSVMDAANNKTSFVLLDEILRGTNSDDKRTGTVEVIKKIISKNTLGAIATHDLKVCDIASDYPTLLTNKCFEVEIVNNDLYFDYKLRDGVCKNKSATFLMQKMGVI